MRLVRRLLPFQRTLARIGHRKRARDHQRLGQAAGIACREHDASDARIERQPRELAAQRRQAPFAVHGTQFLQQLVAVGNRPRSRRLEERKRIDRAKLQRCHAQDYRGQRRAQDFRIGEFRPRGEIVLVVQAHADAVRHAAAAPGALAGRGLRHLLDLQQRRLVAQRIALDARQSRIDHVANPRHRERRFRDVGGEHDPAAVAGREDSLLVGHRQPREQRQDLDLRRIGTAREPAAQAGRRSP